MIALQDDRYRFSAMLDAALAGRPQEVSRRGKPTLMIVSVEEYRRLVLQARAQRRNFADHLMNFSGADVGRGVVRPRDVAV